MTYDVATRNKNIAVEVLERLFNAKDLTVIDELIHPAYIQHSPLARDGAAGLRIAVEEINKEFPHNHVIVKRVLAEGDYVVVHQHHLWLGPGEKPKYSSVLPPQVQQHGAAVIEIVRLERGLLVEHWAVGAPAPDPSAVTLNDNGTW
jgi:predicted SnoaL-like aldol condensation-catalyzing enzyme